MHLRPDWHNPLQPVIGPALTWSKLTHVAIHYTGTDNLIDGDPGEHAANLPAYLRNIQAAYTRDRGYSIGYNFAVDWLGGVWELRGWDIKSAANAGANDYTLAILMLVDGADPATGEAVAAVRDLVTVAERRAGRTLKIQGHGELDGHTTATACPGRGLLGQLHAGRGEFQGGLFSPRYVDPTPTPIPNDPEGDCMVKLIVYVKGDPARAEALVCMDGAGTEMIGFASPGDRNAIVGAVGVQPLEVSAAQYDDFVAHALARRS